MSGADNKLSFLITTRKKDNEEHFTAFMNTFYLEEESEDTKIRICVSKNKQHNGQKKQYKRTNNDQQNIHIKLQME